MTPGPIDEKRARQSRGTVPLEQASETKAIILFVLPHTLSTQNNTQSKLSVGLKKLEICGGINDERNS